jgi:glycosyltransferase involved in cell wall biosynthesis
MAARNEEKFISAAIESIQKQTYKNFELIITDDKSTDSTVDIIKSHMELDSRIHLLHGKAEGPAAARSLAINSSSGEYIMIMDADDISVPNRIESLLSMAILYPLAMIGSFVQLIRMDETPVRILSYPESNIGVRKGFSRLYNRSVMMPGTILASRSIYINTPYNPNLKYLEDWDFVLRASEDNRIHFANYPEPLYHYRLKPNSVSMNWKIRNKYNIMIWYNERQRRNGNVEAESLIEFEEAISKKLSQVCIYKILLVAKFIQHNIWRLRMKNDLGI